MWKELFGGFRQLLTLIQNTERNKNEIEELRKELHTLTAVVQSVIHEMHRMRDHEAHEREKQTLRFENELLRLERRLSGGGKPKGLPGGKE